MPTLVVLASGGDYSCSPTRSLAQLWPHCLNSGVPSEYRTGAPCLGTQCVRCLSPFSNISALFVVQEVMGRAKNATQAFSFVCSLPLLLRRDLLYMGRFCPEVQPLTILYVKVPLSYLFALLLTNGTPCTYRNLEGFIPFDCLFYM